MAPRCLRALSSQSALQTLLPICSLYVQICACYESTKLPLQMHCSMPPVGRGLDYARPHCACARKPRANWRGQFSIKKRTPLPRAWIREPCPSDPCAGLPMASWRRPTSWRRPHSTNLSCRCVFAGIEAVLKRTACGGISSGEGGAISSALLWSGSGAARVVRGCGGKFAPFAWRPGPTRRAILNCPGQTSGRGNGQWLAFDSISGAPGHRANSHLND